MNTTLWGFLHELWVRWSLTSPKYAATIQKIAGILVLIATALVAANTANQWGWDAILVNLFVMKIALTTLLGWVIATFTVVFGIAKLPVEDRAALAAKLLPTSPSATRTAIVSVSEPTPEQPPAQ